MAQNNNFKDEKLEMQIFDNRYFNYSKKLMCLTGLWPYQRRFERILRATFLLTSCMVALLSQLMAAHKFYFNFHRGRFFKGLSSAIFFLGLSFKFSASLFMTSKIKLAYAFMNQNWKMIKDKAEVEILVRRSEFGRKILIIYLAYTFYGNFLYITSPVFANELLDYFIPLSNYSRDKMYVLDGEFTFDKKTNYYSIYIFEVTVTWVSVIMICSIDSAFIVCVHQGLAMIGVLNLRFRSATNVQTGFFSNDIYRNLVDAIKLHQKTLHFFELLDESYSPVFFVIEISTLLWISIGLNGMLAANAPEESSRNILVLFGAFMHIFHLGFQGQLIMDASESIFNAIYQIKWYDCTKEVKNLVLLIMLKKKTPLQLTAGGLHPINIEYFGVFMKSTFSYITLVESLGIIYENNS